MYLTELIKCMVFQLNFLKDKETFDKVADEFLDFIKDKKIIIHNAHLILAFLNYELKLIRKNEIKKDNVIDSLELAREISRTPILSMLFVEDLE